MNSSKCPQWVLSTSHKAAKEVYCFPNRLRQGHGWGFFFFGYDCVPLFCNHSLDDTVLLYILFLVEPAPWTLAYSDHLVVQCGAMRIFPWVTECIFFADGMWKLNVSLHLHHATPLHCMPPPSNLILLVWGAHGVWSGTDGQTSPCPFKPSNILTNTAMWLSTDWEWV